MHDPKPDWQPSPQNKSLKPHVPNLLQHPDEQTRLRPLPRPHWVSQYPQSFGQLKHASAASHKPSPHLTCREGDGAGVRDVVEVLEGAGVREAVDVRETVDVIDGAGVREDVAVLEAVDVDDGAGVCDDVDVREAVDVWEAVDVVEASEVRVADAVDDVDDAGVADAVAVVDATEERVAVVVGGAVLADGCGPHCPKPC